MCGIIGAVSQSDISQSLINGLLQLEYRGYDSAGIAVIDGDNNLQRIRIQGKVQSLVQAMKTTSIHGKLGIAHTRWATHGAPCELNAHPHLSNNVIAVVHNGIIENHDILKQNLLKLGYKFVSDTDTEVASHQIHYHYQIVKNLLLAVQLAAEVMQGGFALAVIHKDHPDELVAICQGCPLVIGVGSHQNFVASDANALQNLVDSIIYLVDGDSVVLNSDSIQIFANKQPISREVQVLLQNQQKMSKGSFEHFMLKEIHEQSLVLNELISGRIENLTVLKESFGNKAQEIFPKVQQIHIVACGTSYHAGLIARYWLESLVKVPVQVDIASEYRYRDIVVKENTLFVAISQSGETADTLAALYKAKSLNYLGTLAICNVATSALVRDSDCVFLIRAGIEIGVASTKAFTTQLVGLLMLACALSTDNNATIALKQLQDLPSICNHVLSLTAEIAEIATTFIDKLNVLFLGRGVHYPVALEGALKLKEISYIHAEAYPAGELKHGPLALVDEQILVIAIAPNNMLLEKLKSNIAEVSARGGQLIVFVDNKNSWQIADARMINIPECGEWISPIVYTIPLQLLAYYVAVAKGTDVDQPRNLAKSVTVE